jgi:prenyltransferase beta subunit
MIVSYAKKRKLDQDNEKKFYIYNPIFISGNSNKISIKNTKFHNNGKSMVVNSQNQYIVDKLVSNFQLLMTDLDNRVASMVQSINQAKWAQNECDWSVSNRKHYSEYQKLLHSRKGKLINLNHGIISVLTCPFEITTLTISDVGLKCNNRRLVEAIVQRGI